MQLSFTIKKRISKLISEGLANGELSLFYLAEKWFMTGVNGILGE